MLPVGIPMASTPGTGERDRAPRPIGWGVGLIAIGVLWILSLTRVDLPQGTTSREGPRNPLPNRDDARQGRGQHPPIVVPLKNLVVWWLRGPQGRIRGIPVQS